jgi:rod shape-determining protein MreD
MTKRLVCLALGLFLIAFESAFFSFFPIEFAKPDLAVPFIIYATFFLGPLEGLIASVSLGFSQELLSGGPAGSILFTKVSVFIGSAFLRSRLHIESRYTFSLLSMGFVVFESVVFLALGIIAKGELRHIFDVSLYVIPTAIFTGMLSLPIFSLLEQFKIRYSERT